MALGPVGALLAAHVAGVRNRLRREVGRNGVWLSTAAVVFFVSTSIGPLLLGLGVVGYFVGRELPKPWAATLLGAIASSLSLFGGIVGGTLGGTRQLTWESYRTFPLSRWHLLAAELLAGLGDMVPFLMTLALLVFEGAVAMAHPVVAPFGLLLVVEGSLFVLVLQLLIGGLAAAVVRRAQRAVGALFVLSFIGAVLAQQSARIDLDALQAMLMRLVDVLPPGFASLGLADATRGHPGLALARHLYPVSLLAALIAIVGWMLGRDMTHEPTPEEGPAGGRRWRFSSPAGGVAELYLRQLLDSSMGRAGLLMPLFTVFVVRGPLATVMGQSAWVVPASYAYTAMSAMSVQTSFFGLDGHGIKALLTLPIRADELLAGKVWALAVYQTIQMVMLTLLLGLIHRPAWGELAGGLLMSVAAFGLLVTVGQFFSSWMPRPVSRQAMQKSGAPLPLAAASLASWGLVSGALSALQVTVLRTAPDRIVPVMALVAAASLGVLRLTRGPAARYLDASRERIADRIGG